MCRRPVLVGARSSGIPCVVPVQLPELAAFSSVRIYIPKDLRPPDARALALKVSSLIKPSGFQLLFGLCQYSSTTHRLDVD